MDAKTYFENLVQFHAPSVSTAENIRAVVKWCFDLLRNMLIVGLLQYFAVKSGSYTLRVISNVS